MENIVISLSTASFLTGCMLNPATGRKQLRLVVESELQLMGTCVYKPFLSELKVLNPAGNRVAAMADRCKCKLFNQYKQLIV